MKRPVMWWTTVKGGRRAGRRPWKWRDPTPRSVKYAALDQWEIDNPGGIDYDRWAPGVTSAPAGTFADSSDLFEFEGE